MGLAGGAIGLGLGSQARATPAGTLAPGDDGTQDSQPFYGLHQSGVTTSQPAAALIASFDVLAEDRAGLERLFRTLTERIAFLMKGGEAATLDPKYPPPDSGLLGPNVFPDNLTVTVALGASLFDERYGLQKLKPTRLVAMEQFPNDALDAHNCHGDVVLQFCSNTAETNIHALRDILRHTPDLLALRWKIDGFLPPHTIKKLGKETVRNLLGFKDGTANLDASDENLDERHRLDAGKRGRTDLDGRRNLSGRPRHSHFRRALGSRRADRPGTDHRSGKGGRRAAHLCERARRPRLCGRSEGRARAPHRSHPPRQSPQFRHPIQPHPAQELQFFARVTTAGQVDMGLLFVCFQADLAAGFLTVQARLNGEQLEEYIKPVGGGYFFALPGVQSKDGFFAEGLLRAAA